MISDLKRDKRRCLEFEESTTGHDQVSLRYPPSLHGVLFRVSDGRLGFPIASVVADYSSRLLDVGVTMVDRPRLEGGNNVKDNIETKWSPSEVDSPPREIILFSDNNNDHRKYQGLRVSRLVVSQTAD